MLWHFLRRAPRFLESHLTPHDNDAAAWLGLIQHYGGPTRLLDFTRSAYVGLYFAFESAVTEDSRALWAVDPAWFMADSAQIMLIAEGISHSQAFGRVSGAQAQLVYSLVHGTPYPDPLFNHFQPFSGVFPVDPWKPDARQNAQQATFMCSANVELGFMDNVVSHSTPSAEVLLKFEFPSTLRTEALDHLARMNVSAATLFPDLAGLARSLMTFKVTSDPIIDGEQPPWTQSAGTADDE
jgi:hypothetical protein